MVSLENHYLCAELVTSGKADDEIQDWLRCCLPDWLDKKQYRPSIGSLAAPGKTLCDGAIRAGRVILQRTPLYT
jgi:hypothetical protein